MGNPQCEILVTGMEGLQKNQQAQLLLEWSGQLHWGWTQLPLQQRGNRGKPFFPHCPQHQFNLSHSGGMALCGLSCKPVGVDIQVVRPVSKRLMERSCTQEEGRWLAEQRDALWAFTTLWTMKESIGKQSGYGLPYPPSKLAVPLPAAGEDYRLDQPYRMGSLWIQLYRGERWCAAVCGATAPPPKILWFPLQEGSSPLRD